MKNSSQMNKYKQMKRNKILIYFLTFLLIFLLNKKVFSDSYESDNYRIQFGNVSLGGENLDSSTYDLSVSVGQSFAQKFNSNGYIVRAGFQYIHSIIPFGFSITDTSVEFDPLIPSNPQTETTDLTVSFGGAGQYQVTAVEETALKTFDGSNSIPDTECDGGGDTCTITSAKTWSSNSAYGFGYNMSGDDVPVDFLGASYYRPFSDRSLGGNPVTIMSGSNVGRNRVSTVTFKINVSNIQPAGTYTGVINFTATPTY